MLLTKNRVRVLCVFCWGYGTLLSGTIISLSVMSVSEIMKRGLICPLVNYASGKPFILVAVPNFIILLVIMLSAYIHVILAMRRRDREMRHLSSQSNRISATVTRLALIIIGKWPILLDRETY